VAKNDQIIVIQSKSVITNSTGASIFFRYSRDIVINCEALCSKVTMGQNNPKNLAVIGVNSL
jgi:hypothetical protein